MTAGTDRTAGRIASGLTAVLVMALIANCGGGRGQLFEKTIPAPSLRGNSIGEPVEQPIAVYLPPGYASDAARYPVVYFVPDRGSDMSDFLDGTYQGFELVEAMDRLIDDGTIQKMIVVLLNGRNVRGEGFFSASPAEGNWGRFLVRDVVRYVDREYKTIPYQETRGIAGHGSGANGALRTAMGYPGVFSAVYAIDPGLAGDADDRIRAYAELAPDFDEIVIEFGSEEGDDTPAARYRYLSDRLAEAGVSSEVIRFDGDSGDKLRERIEDHVLPFFSGALVVD
ncbi:MAG: alpha/beta hydrolase-fold protein [Candidatus Latescibacterota bacterium]|jgi:enterochelin esterase-like enzyme